MSTNGIEGAFKVGYKVQLRDRGPKSSGITFELKSVFEDMLRRGIIKDNNGDGFTKAEATNLYNVLNEMHNSTGRATNYSTMQIDAEFNYSAEEMKQLAQAAGYEVVQQVNTPEVVTPEIEPNLTLEELESTPLPETLPTIEELQQSQEEPVSDNNSDELSDGKILKRDIVNVGESGSKELVYKSKNEDGVTVYRQVNTDPETQEQTLGARLISNDRGLRKNEFYTVGDSIPDGAEVDPKTVDGNKDVLTYSFKDKDGIEQRYVMVKNSETGLYEKGDRLIGVIGNKNYKTESQINASLQKISGNQSASLEALTEKGVNVSIVNSNGEEVYVFKKYGMNVDIEDIFPKPFTAEDIGNIKVSVENLEYEFTENGLQCRGDVNKNNTADNKYFEYLHAIPVYYDGIDKHNGVTCLGKKYSYEEYSSFRQPVAWAKHNYLDDLFVKRAVYLDLQSKKDAGTTLSDVEQSFMSQFEVEIAEFYSMVNRK